MNVLLAIAVGVVYAVSLRLLLRGSLWQLLVALALISHGAHLLLFAAGGLVAGAGLVSYGRRDGLTVALIVPIATGLATLKKPERLHWHKRTAYAVLALVVVAGVTGAWMMLGAERIVTVGP